jgi:hypothetical protein
MTADSSHTSSSQLTTIVTLFVILRVTLVLMYTPQGLLNAYTDFHHYFRTAQLSDQGYYPYINSWSEYPPLLNYTTQLVYDIAKRITQMDGIDSFGYQVFARLLGSVMLIFETGVLMLIHRIAARAWNVERANWVSWVYATLSVPLFYWNASQTSNVAFFTLLAMYGFMTARYARSAIALALGIATKFTPIFLLGSIARLLWPRLKPIARYGLIVLIVLALIYLPFALLGGGRWIVASFASMLTRASWSTPWAMIDGNWGAGDVGDVPTRTQIDLATHIYGNPPVIPAVLILIAFAALYMWLFRRPIDPHDPRHFIWFSTLTLMLFHLWSKGWSPQWAAFIIPLILLSFPNQRGLWLTLLLTGSVFVEWPLAAAFQTNGPAVLANGLLAIAVVSRTLLFAAIAILTARALRLQPAGRRRAASIRPSEDFIP